MDFWLKTPDFWLLTIHHGNFFPDIPRYDLILTLYYRVCPLCDSWQNA